MPPPTSTLDACLNGMIRNVCTRVDVCSAEPANYTEATSTYSLANVAVDSEDFTLAAGNVDGRKVSLVAQSGVTINTPGTATHLAFTDGSALRHVAPCSSIVLTTPAALNLAEFDILEINRFGQYLVGPVEASVAIAAGAGSVSMTGGGSTINASSASQADVAAAIAAASPGDTVQVPAGSATWSTLSINKAISLVGNGIGSTNITLGFGNSVTKQSGGATYVRGFSFSKSGGGNSSKGWVISGAWTNQPVIFEGNDFVISATGLFQFITNGGVIIARNTFSGDWDDSFIQPKNDGDSASWSTAASMGTDDTNGLLNHYIEDNYFYGGTNQGIDVDDGCRCVYRYNTLLYSSFNTHGYATSPVGVRHFEVYNNDFQHNGGTTQIANQNWAIWIRGGTGLIYNNYFDDIAGGYWGDKPEIHFTIRGAEDVRPQGTCGNVSYPVPHQLGQSHNGTSYITDPIYIYSNAGTQVISAGWNWGNPCGLTFSDFWQSGRDYVLNSGAKPGYSAFTYPHPLRTIGDSGTNGYRP